jgi:hypothetical protein
MQLLFHKFDLHTFSVYVEDRVIVCVWGGGYEKHISQMQLLFFYVRLDIHAGGVDDRANVRVSVNDIRIRASNVTFSCPLRW